MASVLFPNEDRFSFHSLTLSPPCPCPASTPASDCLFIRCQSGISLPGEIYAEKTDSLGWMETNKRLLLLSAAHKSVIPPVCLGGFMLIGDQEHECIQEIRCLEPTSDVTSSALRVLRLLGLVIICKVWALYQGVLYSNILLPYDLWVDLLLLLSLFE